jgi:DNA-binding transcriptional LysR family regulator
MNATSRSSLRGLRTFCVAARYESFRTAAEELFITASAVSHQIKSLEQELGFSLFERGTRDLKLTETGRSFYEEVNPLIEQLDGVAAGFRAVGKRMSVRVSVQPFFASELFVPRLSEFTAEHPEIDIQVGSSDETSEKHPSDVDLSIRLFKKPPADMEANLLFPLRLVPAGSPDFKKEMTVKKKQITSDFPLIVYQTLPKAWKQWERDTGIALPPNSKVTRLDSMIAVVRAVTRLDSMIAVVRAAEQGIGAALVPVPLANLWFKQGSIVKLFRQELVTKDSYYLVCSKEQSRDKAVQLLRDWIIQNFAVDD